MILSRNKFKRTGEVKCWSCREWLSYIELTNADGFCPHCDQEIDLNEAPYVNYQREQPNEQSTIDNSMP